MELKILHFYPDLMSLYGSYANVSILKRTLEEMGNTATVERVELGGDADLTHADFVYMGAGTERAEGGSPVFFQAGGCCKSGGGRRRDHAVRRELHGAAGQDHHR